MNIRPWAQLDVNDPAHTIHADGREWITAAEAAKQWTDLTPDAIRLWAYRGKVTGVKVGNRTYYDFHQLAEIDRQVSESTSGRRRGTATTSTARVSSDQVVTPLH